MNENLISPATQMRFTLAPLEVATFTFPVGCGLYIATRIMGTCSGADGDGFLVTLNATNVGAYNVTDSATNTFTNVNEELWLPMVSGDVLSVSAAQTCSGIISGFWFEPSS